MSIAKCQAKQYKEVFYSNKTEVYSKQWEPILITKSQSIPHFPEQSEEEENES